MQYRGIRAFCVAAGHLSFKHAADELSVTPSAISHQIRDLEAYLGCKLFVRGTRALELTLAGQSLQAELRTPMAQIDAALGHIRAGPTRIPLRIEMPAFFSSELFMPRMAEFSQSNQHIDLTIATTEPNEQERRQADLQIVLSSKQPSGGCSQKLFPVRYQPACSPSLYSQWRDKSPQDLQTATLLVHAARPKAWQQWFNDESIALQTPRQTITVDSMYGLARAAQQGAGIALIPLPVSQQWFAKKELIPLFQHQLVSSDFYWINAQQTLADEPALNTLWHWVVDTFSANRKPAELDG